MKKILSLVIASLLFIGPAGAADLPRGGYLLNKDGVPITEEQMTPPAIRQAKMASQSQAVHDAMAALPSDTNTVITLTVTSDGMPRDAAVTQSSGSIVLDEYAMQCVYAWQFKPAEAGGKVMDVQAAIPVHFVSMKIETPASPVSMPIKKANEKIKDALSRNQGLSVPVSIYVNAEGKPEGTGFAAKPEGMTDEDFKILKTYAEESVKGWTFSPSLNPDGKAIGGTVTVTVIL
ncbi:MAG: TonB family protein [Dialister sp.]|nr:TonB family protein [Dialister sp.]